MQLAPTERTRLRKATPLHVLVVDDDHISAQAIGKLLQSNGYDARVANSYREALAAAGEWIPDFVISDIAMPGKDGLELIKTLRRAYPSLKAIAISGRVDPEMAEAARQAGYTEFLPKPIDLSLLFIAMSRALHDGKKA